MTRNIKIGIDHGNFQIKTANGIFPAGLVSHGTSDPGKKDNVLEVDGRYYSLALKRQTILNDKTEDERYYMLTLIAIARELEARGFGTGSFAVNLGVGMPPGQMNGATIGRFESYIGKNRSVRFTFDGKKYNILIKDVMVIPQGIGALSSGDQASEIFKYKHFGIIDIGGGTVEYIAMEDGIIDPAKFLSLNTGTITICHKISGMISKHFNLHLTEEDIGYVMSDAPDSELLGDEIKEAVKNAYRKEALYIIGMAAEIGIDTKTWPILLTGGGARYMKDYFTSENGVAKVVYLDDIKANAIGFEKMLILSGRG